MTKQRFVCAASLAVILGCAGSAAWAESSTGTGSPASATARLDFQVVVPEFLLFQVGTAGNTVDLIEFQPTAADITTGNTSVAATAASGDQGNGTVTVRVLANGGVVEITESNNGGGAGLSSGTDTISYGRIATSSSDQANLPAPALSDAATNTTVVAVTNGNFTNRTAAWTYTFDASGLQADPGTYNGQVTYTAVSP